MPRRLGRDRHIFAFDRSIPPALDLGPGELLTVETHDSYVGKVASIQELPLVDLDHCNPAGGPIRVLGAEPGDILTVDILDVRVGDDAIMAVVPGFTAFRARFDRADVRPVPIRAGEAILSERLRVPLHPMIGVIGVAPAGPPVGTLYGGEHGGNMDTRTIGAGARVYLPVFVPGALLGVGDLHAAQGEGEVFLDAVEIAGEVDLKVQVLKGVKLPTPLVETADAIAPIATDATLDEAAERALGKAMDLLIELAGLDLFDAGRFLSAAGHLRISQFVPPAVLHCRVELPKSILARAGFDLRRALGTA